MIWMYLGKMKTTYLGLTNQVEKPVYKRFWLRVVVGLAFTDLQYFW